MRHALTNRLVVAATGSLLLLSLAGIAATSLPIVAGSIPDPAVRERISHGTAGCQSALPVFDGNIRKRPLAVANEGGSPAFLTCDFDDIDIEYASMEEISIHVVNQAGPAGVVVRCTLVDGLAPVPTATLFFPQESAPIAAGGVAALAWTQATAGPTRNGYYAPAISCSLPAGVAIWAVRNQYVEDVGT